MRKELLKTSEVCEMLGLSARVLHEMANSGHFPKPVEGVRGRWKASEVEAYLKPKAPDASQVQEMRVR